MTITVDKLKTDAFEDQAGAVNIGLLNLVRGAAVVLANWQGGVGIRDSFNVSSYTDVSGAEDKISFTNPMANDDYSAVPASNSNGAGRTYTATGVAIVPFKFNATDVSTDNTNNDAHYNCLDIHGDLA